MDETHTLSRGDRTYLNELLTIAARERANHRKPHGYPAIIYCIGGYVTRVYASGTVKCPTCGESQTDWHVESGRTVPHILEAI